jgi:hypothetical protein
MARGLLLIATSACSLFNGLVPSPLFDSMDQILGIATRGYPLATPARVYNYVTPFAIAVMTLLIAGIPAAIYERIRGLKTSTPVSLGIWLAASVLLSLPTIMQAMGDEMDLK